MQIDNKQIHKSTNTIRELDFTKIYIKYKRKEINKQQIKHFRLPKTGQCQTNLKDYKIVYLKGRYTFGNSQRPLFSLGVSQHKHKITSGWKFELKFNQSCEKMMREKTPLLDEFVCFQIRIKDFWLEVFYYFSEKLPLSQNLCYFRGSRFSQCFILSTALKCSLPSQFFL